MQNNLAQRVSGFGPPQAPQSGTMPLNNMQRPVGVMMGGPRQFQPVGQAPPASPVLGAGMQGAPVQRQLPLQAQPPLQGQGQLTPPMQNNLRARMMMGY